MQHWNLARDAEGIARLVLDRAERARTRSARPVLAELNDVLDTLERDPPRGLVIASGKANGFIAGADVDEFTQIGDQAAAIALVRRGWDTFERLAAAAYPTLALVAASASAADWSSRSRAVIASSSTSRERVWGFPRSCWGSSRRGAG
jgi:3-hydroxyacyl-CoA dehydrogenase/enoyl-CoA hydratase/3-hydroxybutyryl-CoA epimerase